MQKIFSSIVQYSIKIILRQAGERPCCAGQVRQRRQGFPAAALIPRPPPGVALPRLLAERLLQRQDHGHRKQQLSTLIIAIRPLRENIGIGYNFSISVYKWTSLKRESKELLYRSDMQKQKRCFFLPKHGFFNITLLRKVNWTYFTVFITDPSV
jgi:hypothetical protein